jgi:hypothetical protein
MADIDFGKITVVNYSEEFKYVTVVSTQNKVYDKIQVLDHLSSDGTGFYRVPRVGDFALVANLPDYGMYFVIGLFCALKEGGKAGNQTESAQSGDFIVRAGVNKGKLSVQASGFTEIGANGMCATTYSPKRNLLSQQCENLVVSTQGGMQVWGEDRDVPGTVKDVTYYKDINSMEPVVEITKGFVDGTKIIQIKAGPTYITPTVTITVDKLGNTVISSAMGVTVNSMSIKLGSSAAATESFVLGDIFTTLFTQLLDAFIVNAATLSPTCNDKMPVALNPAIVAIMTTIKVMMTARMHLSETIKGAKIGTPV